MPRCCITVALCCIGWSARSLSWGCCDQPQPGRAVPQGRSPQAPEDEVCRSSQACEAPGPASILKLSHVTCPDMNKSCTLHSLMPIEVQKMCCCSQLMSKPLHQVVSGAKWVAHGTEQSLVSCSDGLFLFAVTLTTRGFRMLQVAKHKLWR